MKHWQGQDYFDDRGFILDIRPAKKKCSVLWAFATVRNIPGLPLFQLDDFNSFDEASQFVQSIEPTTPLISLGGRSPEQPMPYPDYLEHLRKLRVLSSMQIYQQSKGNRPELVIEVLDEEAFET